MNPVDVKNELIRQFVNNHPGTRFYAIATMLIDAGCYTGTDLDEKERVNDDINAAMSAGLIHWDDKAGGLMVGAKP